MVVALRNIIHVRGFSGNLFQLSSKPNRSHKTSVGSELDGDIIYQPVGAYRMFSNKLTTHIDIIDLSKFYAVKWRRPPDDRPLNRNVYYFICCAAFSSAHQSIPLKEHANEMPHLNLSPRINSSLLIFRSDASRVGSSVIQYVF